MVDTALARAQAPDPGLSAEAKEPLSENTYTDAFTVTIYSTLLMVPPRGRYGRTSETPFDR